MSEMGEALDLPGITDRLDWAAVERQLDEEGCAATGPLLSAEQCREVVEMVDDDARYRSTITMARHAFGEGRYRYFDDPLPELVQQLREGLYPPQAAIANRWADRLDDGPGGLEAPNGLLERVGHPQHGGVVEALADDHHPGRQTVHQAGGHAARGVARHVQGTGVGDPPRRRWDDTRIAALNVGTSIERIPEEQMLDLVLPALLATATKIQPQLV